MDTFWQYKQVFGSGIWLLMVLSTSLDTMKLPLQLMNSCWLNAITITNFGKAATSRVAMLASRKHRSCSTVADSDLVDSAILEVSVECSHSSMVSLLNWLEAPIKAPTVRKRKTKANLHFRCKFGSGGTCVMTRSQGEESSKLPKSTA